MKEYLFTLLGILGGAVCALFGGLDATFKALIICMAIDYITGTVVALVFHTSTKTKNGAYNSVYGFQGLCKKILMVLFVVVAVQVDKISGTDILRDAVCIGFTCNEIFSIVENMGQAGIPMPQKVKDALEQLAKSD